MKKLSIVIILFVLLPSCAVQRTANLSTMVLSCNYPAYPVSEIISTPINMNIEPGVIYKVRGNVETYFTAEALTTKTDQPINIKFDGKVFRAGDTICYQFYTDGPLSVRTEGPTFELVFDAAGNIVSVDSKQRELLLIYMILAKVGQLSLTRDALAKQGYTQEQIDHAVMANNGMAIIREIDIMLDNFEKTGDMTQMAKALLRFQDYLALLTPEEKQKLEEGVREVLKDELESAFGDTVICPINRPLKTGDVIMRSGKKTFDGEEYAFTVSEKVMGWGFYKSGKVLITKTLGTMRLVTESKNKMPKSLKYVGYDLYKYPVAIPVKSEVLTIDTSDKDRECGFAGTRTTVDYTVTR